MRSLLALLCVWAMAAAEPGATYRAVADALAVHPSRLPGSPGYAAALAAVESALQAAGLKTDRQTFGSAVPVTRELSLTLDGVALPVEALAPNGAAVPTTWGHDLEGPLVWVGDGTLAEMEGLQVEGAIAALRLGSPHLNQVFAQGARAVIAVDDPAASQWQVDGMFAAGPVASPRAWIDAATAQAQGFASARGERTARLRIRQGWEDAPAANLWCRLPATSGAKHADEVLVLAATLSTFGAVPARCPDGRQAANVALLAEIAVRLAAAPRERDLLIVFLGGHYHAQEGARHLYYAVREAASGASSHDPLDARARWLPERADVAARRAAQLVGPEVLTATGDDGFQNLLALRRRLAAQVNELNYAYRQANLRVQEAVAAHREADLPRLRAEAAAVQERIARDNGLRRQLHERTITDLPGFSELLAAVRGELLAEEAWLKRAGADNASCQRLAAVLAGRRVVAHIGLDLADATRPALFNPFGQNLRLTADRLADLLQIGPYAKHLAAYARAWSRAAPALPLVAPDAGADYSLDALCTPRLRSVPAIVPLAQGIMGSQLVTAGDPLLHDHLPTSPAPNLLPAAEAVVGGLSAIVASELPLRIGLQPTLFADAKLDARWDGARWRGMAFERFAKGTEEVAGPAAGAVVCVGGSPAWTDEHVGPVLSGGLAPMAVVGPTGMIFAPGLHEDSGKRVQAIGLGDDGAPALFLHPIVVVRAARLFPGFGGALITELRPSCNGPVGAHKVLAATTDAQAKRNYGLSAEPGQIAYTNLDKPMKLAGGGLLLLGSRPDRPQGVGLSIDPAERIRLDAVRVSAADTAALNQRRLEVLRERNLINRPVERLHADCSDHLESAAAARSGGHIAEAAAHEAMAASLAWRAHEPLRNTANDLLRAVVILLVLSIPFAFAVECLAIGAVSIYRQIAGFIGVFLATFAVLYVAHPAFALASAPIIIFLAFVLILLSAFVISVVMGKFKHELKALQGLSARSHSAGTGASTTFAAIIIGMAGMRNRPLKTALTIATVTLLTFTILVFASFESGLGVVETWLGRGRGAERIELHDPAFLRLQPRQVEAVRQLYSDRFEVAVRTAAFRDPRTLESKAVVDATACLVAQGAPGRAVRLAGVLGLEPGDARRLGGLPPALDQPATGPQPLLLSETVAAQLGVRLGDTVLLRGLAYRLAGTFAEDQLRQLERIDGSRLLPPDYEATLASSGGVKRDTGAQSFDVAFSTIDTSSFIYSPPGLVAVTTPQGALALDGFINGVVLYPRRGDVALGAAAEELAQVWPSPVFSSAGDGARRHFFTSALKGSGYSDLIVPLLLGGLIIFSSLLGSIVDRQKEIFTYSALGLSPKDVGTLFFAESAVVAVVGGLGGYLVGQLFALAMFQLGSAGVIAVPDFNFSSLSALMTILIVMAMVMLSTIYPALMAGRSANPGVNRAWKMPRPEGDRLVFTFPFTVPTAAFAGIVAFVREHFHNHGDAALDVFAAKRVRLERQPEGRLAIAAEVALAPFDLGVYQRFRMENRASDIAGIDEVVVVIERVNGSHGTWLRGNRAFVADLREQFLVWRSLPPETTEHYQAEAQRILDTEAGHGV